MNIHLLTLTQQAALSSQAANAFRMLSSYPGTFGEASLAKGIPISACTLAMVKQVNKVVPIVIKYRGPRRPGVIGRATCLKKDATSFAMYLKVRH
jgi:hypothetical protein